MDDYIVDGLLYCGKCHTPKQCRVKLWNGDIMTPFCLCKCEHERLMREESERKKEEAMDKIRELKRMGFPDSELEECTFEKDDHKNETVSVMARNYVDHFDEMKSKGLLLYGSVGTGKTFISACIANSLIERGYPCLVTNFSRLINTLQGMYQGKQQYMDRLNKFKLLVIDDLASERNTEYANEIVQAIIDQRYRSGLPMIITTNLTADELKHPSDIRKQRIYSRLFEMCIPIEVNGKDRRVEKLKGDYMEITKKLGVYKNG